MISYKFLIQLNEKHKKKLLIILSKNHSYLYSYSYTTILSFQNKLERTVSIQLQWNRNSIYSTFLDKLLILIVGKDIQVFRFSVKSSCVEFPSIFLMVFSLHCGFFSLFDNGSLLSSTFFYLKKVLGIRFVDSTITFKLFERKVSIPMILFLVV